ncbi:MAG: glycosyltransferase [Acidobacteriota bacterium]|nr:glycosyltransferase [Acidobacteriota bacterium]
MPSEIVDFIVPVFNEGKNIGAMLAELYRCVACAKRVLIVYDRDDDDTLPVVRSLAGQYEGLTLLHNSRGAGVLNAIRSGIDAATGDIVIVTMADLSDDPVIVNEMVRRIRAGEADVVCASRYMRGGQQIGGGALKKTMSRLAGLSLHFAGFPVHDATNAFRAYRREVLKSFEIESRGGFEYSLELTAKAYAAGFRIVEVPTHWRDRSAGQSRFRLFKWLPRYIRWYLYALTHRP